MSDDSTPAYALARTHTRLDDAIRALYAEDYREVMLQLDLIRESCAWVEKMMWRRVNAPRETAAK